MEDDLNGKWPQWKTTSKEDDQWKMSLMEDYLNGRLPQWKTTPMEDNLNERQPQWKTTSMKDKINGRQPQWNTTSIYSNVWIWVSSMTQFKRWIWLYWQFLLGRQFSWKQLANLAWLAKLQLSLAQLIPSLSFIILVSCNVVFLLRHLPFLSCKVLNFVHLPMSSTLFESFFRWDHLPFQIKPYITIL